MSPPSQIRVRHLDDYHNYPMQVFLKSLPGGWLALWRQANDFATL